MKDLKRSEVGPTHRRFVESAMSLNAEIGIEDLSKLPPMERRAAALHWYAHELRTNGLTNLRGSELLTLEIRSALSFVNTETTRSTAALLHTLGEVEAADEQGTASILSDMLDQLLADAEIYFRRQLGEERPTAPKGWKIALTLAVVGDGFFAAMFILAYLTREADGGSYLRHMQRGLPVAILGNIIYVVVWLPGSPAGEWIMRRWLKLALGGLCLYLAIILIRLASGAGAEDFYLNLRYFALGAVGLLIARLSVGGRRGEGKG